MKPLLLILFILAVLPSEACFIIISKKNGKVLVGNNEDWYHSDAKYWIEKPKPRKGEKYKTLFFGFKGEFTTAQGGFNEKGLFFDATAVPVLVMHDSIKEGREKAIHPIFKILLKKCATVEEAASELKKYYIPFIRKVQIVFADAKGDYLVLNVNGVSERGHIEEGYKLITNFHTIDRHHICYRYDSADNRLKRHFTGSSEEVATILKLGHQEFPGATVYSNVYDLSGGSVTTYYNHRFDRGLTANFAEDFDRPIYLEEQFSKRMIEALIAAHKRNGAEGALYFFNKECKKQGSEYACDVEQLSDLTTRLLNRGNFADALVIATRNVELYPASDRAHEQLAKAMMYNKDIHGALKEYRLALQINPSNRWANAVLHHYDSPPSGNTYLRIRGFPEASLVTLAGTFNEWQSLQNICVRQEDGWVCTLSLPPGKYFYRFLVDGQWVDDPVHPPKFEIEKGFFVSELSVQ